MPWLHTAKVYGVESRVSDLHSFCPNPDPGLDIFADPDLGFEIFSDPDPDLWFKILADLDLNPGPGF